MFKIRNFLNSWKGILILIILPSLIIAAFLGARFSLAVPWVGPGSFLIVDGVPTGNIPPLLNSGSTTTQNVAGGMTFGGKVGIGMIDPGIYELNVNGGVNATRLCIAGSCQSIWPSGGGGGDITAVSAGIGLSGGGTLGDVILSADTTYLQRRVSGTCAVGSSIRTVDADGNTVCDVDDVGITSESDTLQTVTSRTGGASSTLAITTAGLSLFNGLNNEGNISAIDQLIGNNDLFLKGNSLETASIYYGASDHRFYTGGAEKLTINSAGNVGIGTTTPGVKLTSSVADANTSFVGSAGQYALSLRNTDTTANNWVFLTFDGNSSGNAPGAVIGARFTDRINNSADIAFGTRSGAGFSEKMRIQANGLVGIGTPNPSQVLDVQGVIRSFGASAAFMASPRSGSGDEFVLYNPTGGSARIWGTTNGDLMTITTAGNVGIGTPTPLAPLNLISTSNVDQALVQQWGYTAASNETQFNLKLKQTVTPGFVRWTFDQTNNFTLYPNVLTLDRGLVGIGTPTPLDKLHVNGSLRVSGNSGGFLAAPRSGSGDEFVLYNPTGGSARIWGTTNGDLMTITTAGNVGIVMAGAKLIMKNSAGTCFSLQAPSAAGAANWVADTCP